MRASDAPEIVVVTSCFGRRFWSAVPAWADHLLAFNAHPIEIVSLDGGAAWDSAGRVRTVMAEAKTASLQWGASDGFRLERILSHLAQGRVCVHIDLDVEMKRDYSTLCRLPYDFIVSRAFRFPPFVVERFGFVGCTGFYMAKPSSLGFCQGLLQRMRDKTYGSALDQYVLNAMLSEAAGGQAPSAQVCELDGFALSLDTFIVDGCSIAVLPKEAIERNTDGGSIFGNHDPSLVDGFVARGRTERPESGPS